MHQCQNDDVPRKNDAVDIIACQVSVAHKMDSIILKWKEYYYHYSCSYFFVPGVIKAQDWTGILIITPGRESERVVHVL